MECLNDCKWGSVSLITEVATEYKIRTLYLQWYSPVVIMQANFRSSWGKCVIFYFVCQQIHISKTKLFMYIFYTKSSWKGRPFPWLLIAISEFRTQINAHAKFKVPYTFLILWRQNDWYSCASNRSISHNNTKMTSHKVHRVLNHRQLVCSNRLFRLISKKHQLSALLVLCEENPSVTGGFSSQKASNVGIVPMPWRHQLVSESSINFVSDQTWEAIASPLYNTDWQFWYLFGIQVVKKISSLSISWFLMCLDCIIKGYSIVYCMVNCQLFAQLCSELCTFLKLEFDNFQIWLS